MKILFVTSRLPRPVDRGDRVRAAGFVETLVAEHEVHLVSFVEGFDGVALADDLRRSCASVQVVPRSRLRSVASAVVNAWRPTPLQVAYYRSRTMDRVVGRSIRQIEPDLVVVQMFRMAPYVLGRSADAHTAIDLTDVVSSELERSLPYRPWFERAVYGLEARRVAAFEREVAAAADEVWVISEAERRVLAGSCPSAEIHVVPNRLDLGRFDRAAERPASAGRIVFVGNLSVAHNTDAAQYLVRDVLPRLRRLVTHTTVDLIGADPSRAVKRLAEVDGVSVVGWVPDLADALGSADVLAAPLRFGAGVQNKVLEAMAAGVPVVASGLVCDGLGAIPGEHLLVADDADDAARRIAEIMGDRELRDELVEAGRAFVERYSRSDRLDRRVAAIEADRQR